MAEASIILNKFEFNPRGSNTILELRGNPAGLMRSLLQLLGLDTKVFFVVKRTHITFRFVSFGGQTTITCPLDTVTAMYAGVAKPLWALYLGIMLLVGGIILSGTNSALLPLGFLLSVILIGYFFITKGLTIAFSTGDMVNVTGLVFDAKRPGGKKLTEEDLLKMVEHINRMLRSQHGQSSSSPNGSALLSVEEFTSEVEDEDEPQKHEYDPEASKVNAWIQEARLPYQQGNFLRVVEITSAILEEYPEYSNALRLRMSAYKQLRDAEGYRGDRDKLQKLESKAD